MNKSLLLLTDTFPFGNSEQFLETELPYLEKNFRSITIFPLERGATQSRREIPENISVLTPPLGRLKDRFSLILKGLFNLSPVLPFIKEGIRSGAFTNLGKLRRWGTHFLLVRQLLSGSFFKNNASFFSSFDVLYFYWGLRWSQILPFLPVKLRPAIAVRFHGSDLYEHTNDNYIPWRKEQLEMTGTAIVISETGAKYFNDHYPWFNGRIIISRIGTDDRGINPYFRSETIRIVSCSNIVDVKRVDLLAQAICCLDFKTEWIHFGDGPLRPGVDKVIATAPGHIRTRLAGKISHDELMRYYGSVPIDLFVNVSSSEGVPVSVMEALSFGIPVVATNAGGTGELVSVKVGALIDTTAGPVEIARIITSTVFSNDYYGKRLAAREQWSIMSQYGNVYPPFVLSLTTL